LSVNKSRDAFASMRWDARRTPKRVAGLTREATDKADCAFWQNPLGTDRLGRLLALGLLSCQTRELNAMSQGDLETALSMYEPGASLVVKSDVLVTGTLRYARHLRGSWRYSRL